MDMTSPLLMSVLSGAAAALAVAIMLTVYARSGYRTVREIAQTGVAAVISLGLLVFVVSDMRHAALAYLGINASKPEIEFEIRVPQTILSTMSDTQVELHTDRNQTLARLEGSEDAGNGRGVLRGVVAIDYRTTDRIVVLNLPGRAQCEFKLRLAAEPSRSTQFGPWHLADRVAVPLASGPVEFEPRENFAIRYRVL
jgi:hypothetical protein